MGGYLIAGVDEYNLFRKESCGDRFGIRYSEN